MTRLRIGEYIKQFPTGTWNRLVDGLSIGENPQAQDRSVELVPRPTVEVLVLNNSGASLIEHAIAGIDKPALNAPEIVVGGPDATDLANDAILKGVQLEVLKPDETDHETSYVITRQPIGNGKAGRAYIVGIVWVRVDIKSADDEVCGPVTDQTDKLESGKGSTPILWKPAGTGVKWCVVVLGGGGKAKASIEGAFAIIKGTVSAASYNVSDPDPNNWTVTPGKLVAVGGTEGAVLTNPDGTIVLDDDGDPQWLTVRSPSRSEIVGPILLAGTVSEFGGEKTFNAIPPDLSSLPDFVEGDIQIPYHKEGEAGHRLGGKDCGA